jgi:hypothetical protein
MTHDELVARAEMHDVLVKYATAASNSDWDAFRSCFTPDARCDYTEAGGVAGGLDEIVDWLTPTLATFDALQFIVVNTCYCFDGDDRCGTRTEFQTVMRIAGDKPVFIRAGGHYDDVFTRTATGWLLSERVERLGYVQM